MPRYSLFVAGAVCFALLSCAFATAPATPSTPAEPSPPTGPATPSGPAPQKCSNSTDCPSSYCCCEVEGQTDQQCALPNVCRRELEGECSSPPHRVTCKAESDCAQFTGQCCCDPGNRGGNNFRCETQILCQHRRNGTCVGIPPPPPDRPCNDNTECEDEECCCSRNERTGVCSTRQDCENTGVAECLAPSASSGSGSWQESESESEGTESESESEEAKKKKAALKAAGVKISHAKKHIKKQHKAATKKAAPKEDIAVDMWKDLIDDEAHN